MIQNSIINKNLDGLFNQIRSAGSFWYLHPIFSKYWLMKHKIWPWVKQNQSFLFPFIATNKLSTSKQLAEVKRKSKNKRKKSKKRKNNDNKNLPDNSYQNLSDKSENFNSLSHRPRIGTEPCIDSENDVSNTSFELTIDNTWIEYTRIHQLHAQKREKFKLELSEKYDKRDSTKLEFPEPDYIDVKDINQYDTNFNPSSKTPNYRPNEIRKIQLNQLYGDDYAKSIAYMETALQNTFENYCQKYNPTLWPIIPFNL